MRLFTKKLFTCILSLNLTLSLMACGDAGNSTEANIANNTTTIENSVTEVSPSSTKSLYQHGMDVVTLMEEMLHNELYLSTMTGSSEIQAKADELASGDYSVPKAVYEITPPDFTTLLALLEEETEGMGQFSEALQTYLDTRSANALLSQLNATEGAVTLATTSVFTAGKIFVNGMLTENLIYIYTFENGYPIAITFTKGEGGAVGASGTFLLTDTVSTESAEALEQSLNEFYLQCTVKEVDMK